MEEFMGSILHFAFNYAPQDWMVCHGESLQINQYQALYSLLGTKFGGDGITNFKLPDLRKKDVAGNYYNIGDIMADGSPYIDSYICVVGIYPPRSY